MTIAIYLGITLALLPEYTGSQSNDIVSGVYSAISRTMWAIGLAWITYACSTGNSGFINSFLTFKPFIPLSKITYAAYLIHPVVIATFYGSRQTAFQFSHYLMVSLFIFTMVFLKVSLRTTYTYRVLHYICTAI